MVKVQTFDIMFCRLIYHISWHVPHLICGAVNKVTQIVSAWVFMREVIHAYILIGNLQKTIWKSQPRVRDSINIREILERSWLNLLRTGSNKRFCDYCVEPRGSIGNSLMNRVIRQRPLNEIILNLCHWVVRCIWCIRENTLCCGLTTYHNRPWLWYNEWYKFFAIDVCNVVRQKTATFKMKFEELKVSMY